MKYFAFLLKSEIMIIGLLMMYMNPVLNTPPFMSGLAIFTIGLYLALQGIYGSSFSGCIFVKEVKKREKKKGLFNIGS